MPIPKKTPHPVDVHVGGRIRMLRILFGMNQDRLGEHLGLSFQQIQKYERGANRIAASRLYQFSRIFSVPVELFFGDMPPEIVGSDEIPRQEGIRSDTNLPMTRETARLVRFYYSVPNQTVRRIVHELIKNLAQRDPGGAGC